MALFKIVYFQPKPRGWNTHSQNLLQVYDGGDDLGQFLPEVLFALFCSFQLAGPNNLYSSNTFKFPSDFLSIWLDQGKRPFVAIGGKGLSFLFQLCWTFSPQIQLQISSHNFGPSGNSGPRGIPSEGYICKRCGIPGHFVQVRLFNWAGLIKRVE